MVYRRRFNLIIAAQAILWVSGCTNIGPGTIARDRFDYVDAISDSWKRQTLLNTVKMRYADAPVFVDVSSIVNQYSLAARVDGALSWDAVLPGNSQMLAGSGIYADRPTITYQPLRGDKFTRSLMTPIPPASVVSLIQSRWPVDMVLRICAQSVNGMYNRMAGQLTAQPGDLDFYRLIDMLERIQKSRAWSMRVEKNAEGKATAAAVIFRQKGVEAEMAAEVDSVKKLLGLDADEHEFEVVYGEPAANDMEIAILTRSMMEILSELASYIDIPASHLAEHRATADIAIEEDTEAAVGVGPLIRIRSSPQRPDDAFVAVKYREHWFWIDDCDIKSKKVFSFLMFLFTLAETGMPEQVPVLTIPTR
ncbi:MAG: hypothetical protein DRP66_09585 [Planctomycetota bacterium]|nr:MAG: hypothetical protein DRP66_09585 [Planctomycetota bacterium]